MGELQLHVYFQGRNLALNYSPSSTLAELGQQLHQLAHVQPSTVKLLLPGRKGGPLTLEDAPQRTLADAGVKPGMRIMLVGSTQEQVEAVQRSRDLPGLAGFDHELKQAARRRRTQPSQLLLPSGPYTFQHHEAWQQEGLEPEPRQALKLLHRLAADPGIVGVMQKHRWQVGLLSEMPPEGKVGVSPVCILGVNINAGQEISLRLRTDDLKGFRRYDRIRETLCHELAHMVWGEHDNNFKALNSQLLRECAEFDWTSPEAAHTLVGAAAADSADDSLLDLDDVMAASAASSGKTLKQLAADSAHAAESAYGDQSDTPMPDAQRAPVSSSTSQALLGSNIEDISGLNHRHDSTEMLEAAARSLGADPAQALQEAAQEASATQALNAQPQLHAPATPHSGASSAEASQSAHADPAALSCLQPSDNDRADHGSQLQDVKLSATDDPVSAQAGGLHTQGPHIQGRNEARRPEQASRAQPSDQQQQPHQLDSAHAAAHPTHAAADQPPLQASPPTPQAAPAQPSETREAQGDLGLEAARAGDESSLRYQRAQQAAQALVQSAGAEEGKVALQTLATMLQNAMHKPGEERYRRVREHNAAFQARVGRFQAAVDILQVAGFVRQQQGADAILALVRNDPGLLWIALSAVTSALAAQGQADFST